MLELKKLKNGNKNSSDLKLKLNNKMTESLNQKIDALSQLQKLKDKT